MTNFDKKIGILDPEGLNDNPLTNKPYSQQYKDLAKLWSTYPAYLKAEEILESIEKYQLIFIISNAGSGKTVMLPKFALHYLDYQGKIAITLPKRVVTLSAASFAAKTMDIELGEQIGYIYKGSDKSMAGPKNKLVYMTDGTLIMKLTKDPLLTEYNIIILDEAHERKAQMDILLLLLKKLLQSGKRPDLRVVIMSATIDGDKYQQYFTGVTSKIINISGQPLHSIVVNYLDQPTKSYIDKGLEIMGDLITSGTKKDMLFFITTSEEALRLCRTIRPKYPKVYCIEVYADMDKTLKEFAESRDKYLELGSYNQKLIMATNVAESSLTIDGLKYVIDSCYELYSYFDPINIGAVLEKRLITKAQALQRRGRVGRTEEGICYHLVTKEQFDSLESFPAPDIIKQDITIDMLKMIQLTENKTYNEGYELLNELMDPPKKQYIELAKKLYTLYKVIDNNGYITKLGYDITNFSSISINRSLFLIYAYQLFVAREASIILAMLDALKGKISNLFYKADTICESGCEKSSSKKLIRALVDKRGDHLTFLNIYEKFKNTSDQKTWARKYGIRLDVLNSVDLYSNVYYYKIINISRAPQFDRVKVIDSKKRLLEVLKMSHQHLTANKMVSEFTGKNINATINKDSAVYYNYDRKTLSNKSFIYDELININGNWEYSVVTLI